jgi:formylglycine-generating enzyme required for sulfatase activity
VWNSNYNGAPTDGSAWIDGSDRAMRVQRGGSWFNLPGFLRSANRNWGSPASRDYVTGFRIARSP